LPVASVAEESKLGYIPEGAYKMKIIESTMKNCSKTANDPSGKYLEVVFQISEGDYKGHVIKEFLNIVNKNDKAKLIAIKFLNNITYACCLESINDSNDLHGIEIVGIVKNKQSGDYINSKVTKVLRVEDFDFESYVNVSSEHSSKSHGVPF